MTNQEKLIKIQEVIRNNSDADQTVLLISRICNFREQGEINIYYRTLQDIENDVCQYFGITPETLKLKSREMKIVQARQFAFYKAIRFTNSSAKSIGYFFGRKDHSTVYYSFNSINGYLQTDRKFREKHEEFLRS